MTGIVEYRVDVPPKPQSGVDLIAAASIIMRPVAWLWPGWLARGKFHLIGGAPGTGKTTLSTAIAATVTVAGRWPDGAHASAGNVLVWSGEDDPADTLVPRLVAAGADLSRVYFVDGTRSGDTSRSFDPATDLDLLAIAAEPLAPLSLIIVDPVVSAVAGDSHKNSEVRRALQPLVDMADRLGAAVLGITHFSKGSAGRDPTERVTGSIAFGALARVVMVAAKRQDGEQGGSRMLARAKSNIGPDGGGFGYDLGMVQIPGGIEASRVLWGDPLEGSARELLGDAEAVPDSPRDQAATWLAEMLEVCPVQVTTIREEAKASGLSWRTIERAKSELRVDARRQSIGNDGKGGWVWALPGKSASPTPPTPPQKVAVLREPHSDNVSEPARSARPPHSERDGLGGLATGQDGADAFLAALIPSEVQP